MLVLRANAEMKATFEKLIAAMGERVEWTGNFVIIDNYLILHGELRSLFFNFDNKKVVPNIIDIPIKEKDVVDVSEYPKIQNIINMVLYAFGRWGTIKGIRVEKDSKQLNQLFAGILKEINVEPDYNPLRFYFLKNGVKVTYEDVLMFALEEKENPMKAIDESTDGGLGLWHKLIWKHRKYSFAKLEVSEEERRQHRIGRNFYMVGYTCPMCGDNLHMVVFPMDKPLKIDTEDGQVNLARAYTCDACDVYYTPRPGLLLVEGDVHEMNFNGDRKAYEDYKELLGAHGARTSNYKFNEYVNKDKQKDVELERRRNYIQDEEIGRLQDKILKNADAAQFEKLVNMIPEMGQATYDKFNGMVEEGYYPLNLVERFKGLIEQKKKHRQILKDRQGENNGEIGNEVGGADNLHRANESEKGRESDRETSQKTQDRKETEGFQEKSGNRSKQVHEEVQTQIQAIETDNEKSKKEKSVHERSDHDPKSIIDRFLARINVLERLSDRQRAELKKEIEKEEGIDSGTKRDLIEKIEAEENKAKVSKFRAKYDAAIDKNYGIMNKVFHEISESDLPEEVKRGFLLPLREYMQIKGEKEVQELMGKMPPNMDRAKYKAFHKKLKEYSDIDISPFMNDLEDKLGQVEKQEIVNTINRARKKTREDILELMKRLESQDFEEETLRPYMEQVKDKLREIDEKMLDQLCGDFLHLDFDSVADIYDKVSEGDFLPELKTNALESLRKRLSKLKTDECELLVNKLKDEMEGKIKDNPRHHFYPARKILMKEASPEEVEVIDFAVATYASNKGEFEYPIIVVDTSRNGSGKEGMIITPEKVYCSTLLNAYYIPIPSITDIKISTGLLNKGITVEQGKGNKLKIPYAVSNDELKNWGKVLLDFITYLKEKPQSRQVKYLAKEKHETICCLRCGYRYKGALICPECGYKNNR